MINRTKTRTSCKDTGNCDLIRSNRITTGDVHVMEKFQGLLWPTTLNKPSNHGIPSNKVSVVHLSKHIQCLTKIPTSCKSP
ncbi:hypothetical protein ACE6H2_008210 [Prunus campanulata]